MAREVLVCLGLGGGRLPVSAFRKTVSADPLVEPEGWPTGKQQSKVTFL